MVRKGQTLMQAAPSQYTAPMSCTAESLSLQYGGYKIHVASSKKKKKTRLQRWLKWYR